MTRRIGVVIVTYNCATLIDRCLDAVADAAPEHRVDVVVVDNDSTDDSVAISRAHSSHPTVLATGRNAGYSAGINIGVEALRDADQVLVLNPDCRLDPGALSRLSQELVDSGAGIVAPKIRDPDGTTAWSIHRHPTLLRAFGDAFLGTRRAGRHPRIGEQETRPTEYAATHDVDWASGAVLLASRECLAATGPWDERFFLYSEEADYQIRATHAGHRIRFVSDASVTHDGGDAPVSGRLWALLIVNKIVLYRKFHGPVATFVYRIPVVLTEVLRAARGREPSRAALRALFSRRYRQTLYPRLTDR